MQKTFSVTYVNFFVCDKNTSQNIFLNIVVGGERDQGDQGDQGNQCAVINTG